MSDSPKVIIDVTRVDPSGRIIEMNYASIAGKVNVQGATILDVGDTSRDVDGIPDAECTSHLDVKIEAYVLNEALKKLEDAEVCSSRPVTDNSKSIFKKAQSALNQALKQFGHVNEVTCRLRGEKSNGSVECAEVGRDLVVVLNDNDGDGKPERASMRLTFPYTSEIFSISVSDYPIALIKGADALYKNAGPAEEPKKPDSPDTEDAVLDHS
ncbi:MAG: hypothetical protein HYY43_02500 [Deltaproteobacteria bacterium]|nr:hypothetical protein [Deltaproteobacteria bacterium]MBI2974444.1 hypothetical protein [Deltaproteobacteria bacterium]